MNSITRKYTNIIFAIVSKCVKETRIKYINFFVVNAIETDVWRKKSKIVGVRTLEEFSGFSFAVKETRRGVPRYRGFPRSKSHNEEHTRTHIAESSDGETRCGSNTPSFPRAL